MTDQQSDWKPDTDAALKTLIRETIKAAGSVDPHGLPSKVRERIMARAVGDLDVDAYIVEVLAEMKK